MKKKRGSPEFTRIGPVRLPLCWSGVLKDCTLQYFDFSGRRYLVVEVGAINRENPKETLVRIQSACVLGDLFGSRWCDCAWQFREAKRLLFEEGRGLLIHGYDQNGKGLSLENHFRVYAEGQANKLELLTESFDFLGFKYENRDYSEIGAILRKYYHISDIKLLTNDPIRLKFFVDSGFRVQRIQIQPPIDEYNETELRIKKEKFGHLIRM
jgi:GTP cyclohydrolase II